MNIEYINNTDHKFNFDVSELLERLVDAVVTHVGYSQGVSVGVSVVSSEEIRELNREHRGIDRVTDVLSFPMNEFEKPAMFEGDVFESSMTVDPETDELLLGDVVLCYDKVVAQAEEYGHSVLREFSFLTVHSLLHLFGYDHETDADRSLMEREQDAILAYLKINR